MDENTKGTNGVVDSMYSGVDDEGATTVLTANPVTAGKAGDDEGATTVLVAPGVPSQTAPQAPQFGNAPQMRPQGMPPSMQPPMPSQMQPQGMAPGMQPQMQRQGMAPGMQPPMPSQMQPQGMAPGMQPPMPPQMQPQGMAPGMQPQIQRQGMAPGMQPQMQPQGMAPGMQPQMQPQGMAPGMQQQMQPQKAPKNKPPKPPKMKQPGAKKKTGLILGIIAAVLVAAGVGVYFLFFTPAKRFERRMEAAREAVSASRFEDAKTKFKEALEIDKEDMEAMFGVVNAEKELGDTEAAKADAEAYREVIKGFDQDKLEKNGELIQEFYVETANLYRGDLDKQIAVYKEGYDLIPTREKLKLSLAQCYVEKADALDSLSAYEDKLSLYDDALAVDSANSAAKGGKTSCAREVLDDMIAAERYDDAEAFVEKYRNSVEDVDFDSYLSTIEKERTLTDARHDVMEKTISYMSAADYEAMMEVDGSENAAIVVSNMDGDRYVYAQSGYTSDYTGKGAGIYKLAKGGYYFYYGDYQNGVRSGYGILFIKMDGYNKSYQVYEGSWSNDAPNGEGKLMNVNEVRSSGTIDRTWQGNFKNGLVDGVINMSAMDNGDLFEGSFTATEGDTPDIRDQYPDYDFSGVSEGHVVYAVLEMEGSTDFWWFSHGNGYLIGVTGFVD